MVFIFHLHAEKNKLTLLEREPVTSGSANIYGVRFEFSAEWEGLDRTAVFEAAGVSREVLLGSSGACVIPWEVLAVPGVRLRAGVYGKRGGEIILPTVWANLGVILEGVPAGGGEGTLPPTPEIWEQELSRKGDGLGYTEEGDLGLFSGDKLLSSVPVSGGEGGTTDHRLLSGRTADNQHPIASISGLEQELKRIPAPVEPLTNEDLEEILK